MQQRRVIARCYLQTDSGWRIFEPGEYVSVPETFTSRALDPSGYEEKEAKAPNRRGRPPRLEKTED